MANPAVDPILDVLHKFGIVSNEMESEKHEERVPLEKLQAMLGRIGFEKFVVHRVPTAARERRNLPPHTIRDGEQILHHGS